MQHISKLAALLAQRQASAGPRLLLRLLLLPLALLLLLLLPWCCILGQRRCDSLRGLLRMRLFLLLHLACTQDREQGPGQLGGPAGGLAAGGGSVPPATQWQATLRSGGCAPRTSCRLL